MVSQKYRWDFIGLSTDTKPTSETSEKVVNGSTYYCSDTSKLYVYCDGTWYERKPLGGGGGGGTSNFNDLSNRPKYNGSEMTGSTNIPEVKNYTAGTNVSISDQNVISATDTTYTAGTNVSISDQNVISATDTTYSAFTGTDGTSAGAAGLVPAPATTDAGKFLKADGTWDTAGGGGGPTVVQTTGTSTTDVMSQNAVTSMVFADPSMRRKVQIGANAQTYVNKQQNLAIGYSADSLEDFAIAIGNSSRAGASRATAIGNAANAAYDNSIAIGTNASTSMVGEMNIGAGTSGRGYNSSNYRLLTGLYDPQSAHDAATKGYVDPTTDSSAPTTATVGRLGQIQIDTTTATAYMCVAVDTVTPAYTWKKITA